MIITKKSDTSITVIYKNVSHYVSDCTVVFYPEW